MSSCSRARALLATVAAAFVVLAASCTGNGDTVTIGDSGIDGLVTIGPTCPVVQEDTPCPDQPYQATIVVLEESGEEVTRVTSGEDGRFRLRLAPRSYTLVPQSPNAGAPPFASEVAVEVKEHEFAEVAIAYDSGIR